MDTAQRIAALEEQLAKLVASRDSDAVLSLPKKVLPARYIVLKGINTRNMYPKDSSSSSITKGYVHIIRPRTDSGAETMFEAKPLVYGGYNFDVTFELLPEYVWPDNAIRIKFSFKGLDGKFFDVQYIDAVLQTGSTVKPSDYAATLFTAAESAMLWDGAGLPRYDESMFGRIRAYEQSKFERMQRDPAHRIALMLTPDPYEESRWRTIFLGKTK